MIRKTLIKNRFLGPPTEDGFSNFIDSNLCLGESEQTFFRMQGINVNASALNAVHVNASGLHVSEASYTARSVISTSRSTGILLGASLNVVLTAASPTSATFTPLNGQYLTYRNSSVGNKFISPSDPSYQIDNLGSGAALTIGANTTKKMIVFSSAKLVKTL